MFKNYLKTAWRNLLRHKVDTSINLVGLCIAFTSAILLLLSVYYEFSFDSFHKKADRTYHLYFEVEKPDGKVLSETMPVPLMPALKAMYPDIEGGVRIMGGSAVIRYGDKTIDERITYTDADFFSMFSFPMEEGTAANALDDPSKIVLSKTVADAVFGDEDPLHKTVALRLNGEWENFTVGGVAAEAPPNSSIRYDVLVRFEKFSGYQDMLPRWDNRNHNVYVTLRKDLTAAAFEKKLPRFINQYLADDIEALKRDGSHAGADGALVRLKLQPLSAIHTDPKIGSTGSSINRNYLYMLLVIAVLILVIACINFVNLSLGRSFTRSREIGLRKTLGARPWQLAFQFWSEALILCTIALVISYAAAYFLQPGYKQLFDMNLRKEVIFSPIAIALVTVGFIGLTLLAGGYPAWVMSRFNIINILKGKLSVKHSQKLRYSLVVVQFCIAILLMVCTLVAWQQINYLRSRPLGYNRHQVISIPLTGNTPRTATLQRMRTALANYPAVESVSGIYDNLGTGTDGSKRTSIIGFDYKEHGVQSHFLGISYDFVQTLGLELAGGRDFSRDLATDSNNILINEAMARQLGEDNAVGKMLDINPEQPARVIGVLKDFNFKSLHSTIAPLSLVLSSDFPVNYILVKVKAQDLPGSMALLKKTWKEVAPGQEFLGSFLDENIDRQYNRETKVGTVFIIGAVLAILLSCMGLLAMVILIVTQRIKEIGVRKVLGASTAHIVLILSKDFMKLVGVAIIVAFPVGWWLMHNWLEQYAYRTSIAWWIFVMAAMLAGLIALATISIKAIQAALSNPVKSLRSE